MKKKYKDKVNYIFLYGIVILICLRNTLLYYNKIFDVLLPIGVCLSFILFFGENKKANKDFFEKNVLLIIYFIIRFISLIFYNDKILGLKLLIYEIFFLVIVLGKMNKNSKTIVNVAKLIVLINFICNVLSIFYSYVILHDFNNELFGIYTNSNAIANLTSLSIILYYTYLKDYGIRIIDIVYILFSFFIIFLSKSRTSILCILVYFLLYISIFKFKFNYNKVKWGIMVTIISVLVLLIGFCFLNNNLVPNKMEYNINEVTTNRFYLWKYSIYSLRDSPIIGVEENKIGEKRKKYIPDNVLKNIPSNSRVVRLGMNNNHNGFIQLLVGNGILCFIIFIVFLCEKIKYLEKKEYLIVMSILIINLFENELILTQSIYIFVLMYFIGKENLNEKYKSINE